MRNPVREDGGDPARWRRVSERARMAVCALACACWAAPAVAQGGGAGGEFRAKVLDMGRQSQRVTVPVNGSIIVETSVRISRADVVASHIADVQPISPTQLLVTGGSYGQTNVVLWDSQDRQYLLDVEVEMDLSRLNEALGGIDPLSDVVARSLLGNVILTGTVTSAERAERMVALAELFVQATVGETGEGVVQNHLGIAGEQQVLLRCVVAEVTRKAARELGINGFLAGDNVRDAFLVNQLGGINPINIGAAADTLVTGRIPFLTGEDGIPLEPGSSVSLGFPRLQMQLFIRAMADNSLLSVLAEPNLVAISGETASFLAGGEFPVPVPQGNQTVTIEFREFGVRLNFTPVVKAHQRIRLRIAQEVSELDFSNAATLQGFVIPGLTSRSAQTTVEVGNGQTIAIAGLLSERVRGLASRIPGIGDVPVLGALFRSVKFERSVSELVIFVTPEIVAPLDAHQEVTLPGRDRTDPNDFELYVLGLLEGTKQGGEGDARLGGSLSADGPGTLLRSQPEELSIHGPWGWEQANASQVQ